jgi:hypothetical protein
MLIQGGVGGPVVRGVDLGVAGYALWQVTDDRGADLPAQLRGLHERSYGAGPEVDVAIPAIRARATARLVWDLDGQARPMGATFVVGVTYRAVNGQ